MAISRAAARPSPLWLIARRQRLSANQILSRLSIGQAPVDVFQLARRMGVDVHVVGGLPYSGAVEATEHPPRATVWINGDDIPARQRFTLAHELGHLMLHPMPESGMLFRDVSFEGGDLERQANWFAADLLVPLPLLQRAYSGLGADVEGLADLFQVSMAAMRIRLLKLNGVSL